MNDWQRKALTSRETDVDGAIYRFGGNEEIYISCLNAFFEDGSMLQFRKAFAAGEWETAIAAVHTLKGVAGNMGFVPLMCAAQQTLSLLRAGEYSEAEATVQQLERSYLDVMEGIQQFWLHP